MTRPSRNQDQLLIKAGKKLLPELGVSGMSIQRVADEAGVNLGMFSYHFKTKANFIRIVLDALREDALRDNSFEIPTNATSIVKLKTFLLTLATNFRNNSGLALAMFRDFLNQDPDITKLVLSNTNQQFEVLRDLIKECQTDGYVDSRLSIDHIQSFCSNSIKGPIIMAAALDKIKSGKKKTSSKSKKELVSNDAIEEIIEMVLRGIAPKEKKKR